MLEEVASGESSNGLWSWCGRGVDQDEAKARAKQRLQEAKNRYCSACKRKGHWHKDAACPPNKGVNKDHGGSCPGHECHVVFATAADNDHIGIADEDVIQLNPALQVFEAGEDNGARRPYRKATSETGGHHGHGMQPECGYDWFQECTRLLRPTVCRYTRWTSLRRSGISAPSVEFRRVGGLGLGE